MLTQLSTKLIYRIAASYAMYTCMPCVCQHYLSMSLMFLVSFCVDVSSHMILSVILYRHVSLCSQYCSRSCAYLVFSMLLAICQYLLYSQLVSSILCQYLLCSQCHSVLVSLSLYYQLVSTVLSHIAILDVLNHSF